MNFGIIHSRRAQLCIRQVRRPDCRLAEVGAEKVGLPTTSSPPNFLQSIQKKAGSHLNGDPSKVVLKNSGGAR